MLGQSVHMLIRELQQCAQSSTVQSDDSRFVLQIAPADVGRAMVAGNIGDALYGASLIPNLKVLYLANQTFTGTLPTNNIAWKTLEEMDLSNNNIEARPAASLFS